MRHRRVLALAAGGAAAGWLAWRWFTAGGAPHPVVARRPLLIAHRGGAGLAPENTVEAFAAAVTEWGADMVELDVRATSDGACVVMHDPMVDRTTNGTGHVASMLLAEIRDLDAGYRFRDAEGEWPFRDRGVRVPLLEEVLDAIPETPVIVELKTADAQVGLRRAIRRCNARDRVIVAGERSAYRSLFRGWDGATSASTEQLRPFWLLHRAGLARLARPSFDVVQIPETWDGRRIVTPELVEDLHLHGIPVHVWTVNEPADMRRLLEWGVDGILSDRPDLLAEVLHRHAGRPLPPARSGVPSGPKPME